MNQVTEAIYENGSLRLSAPLEGVAEGQRVRVLVEGLSQELEEIVAREAAFLRYMEAKGLLVKFPLPAEPAPKNFKPLVIEGEPLSETIIRERR